MATDYMVLENIVKEFRDGRGNSVRAVDNISLRIQKGEFVTLLGPSGCGKTTTLRMVAGFEAQDSGDIFVNGKNINNTVAFHRNMPMVFQSFALFPHLSIFENIAYGLKVRKMSRDDIRNDVEMACQMVNLTGLENRYPGEISGGQQQRVALARALVLKPEIILFDEPLSNLDAKLRIETRVEIKRVQQMLGITALYVTHDQSEALSMSDKIVIMHQGRIVQVGTPEEIYHAPSETFVADFIGHANFIPAQVTATGGEGISVKLEGKTFQLSRAQQEASSEAFFQKGEEVVLSIKPEAVGISKNDTGLKGNIAAVSFLGATTEYKVVFGFGFITIIHNNTRRSFPKAVVGDKIFIDFRKEFFRIYKK